MTKLYALLLLKLFFYYLFLRLWKALLNCNQYYKDTEIQLLSFFLNSSPNH